MRIYTIVLCSALTMASAVHAAGITREVPVTSKFVGNTIGTTAGSEGMEYKINVIVAKGIIEVCGAVLFRRGTTKDKYRGFLRDSAFTINGKKVVKDLTYLHSLYQQE